MCGIVAYIGPKQASDILVGGLDRLEYRGYDSAGVVVRDGEALCMHKAQGRLDNLRQKIAASPLSGSIGIGHTRWATHGVPNEVNAHPQFSADESVMLVHNGIIENYKELKDGLIERGFSFQSETDTEVMAHLIQEAYKGNLEEAVREVIRMVRGAYALVVMHKDHREIVAVRTVSPMVLGVGEGNERLLGSDVAAIMDQTRQVIYLEDGDFVILSDEGHRIVNIDGQPIEREVQAVDWDLEAAQKGGFPSFMEKEVFDQPQALSNTLLSRIGEDGGIDLGIDLDPASFDKIDIVACGTAYYAGMVGKYLIEQIARVPVEIDVASEYRYRQPVVTDRTLAIAVSQSGETIDTLEGMREAARQGAQTMGIINAKGSSMTRELGHTLYIHAGPEIGVASTKAYTSMVSAFLLLALWLGEKRGTISAEERLAIVEAARQIPALIEESLSEERLTHIRNVANTYHQARNYLFLGRGVNSPTAFEGALKLKEISYIHAEAYAAGEMKHGPIALIDEHLPVVAVATESRLLEKTISNVQEVRARGGKVILILSDGDTENADQGDEVIYMPRCHEMVSPVINAVAMQLLALYTATALGKDVDKPRNLAKSVTVE